MTARGTALAASALAISLGGIGLALYLSRPKGPPPPPSCTCPSGDVCPNASGTCPSGYQPDPSAPGCCEPTGPQTIFFQVNGTSNIDFTCNYMQSNGNSGVCDIGNPCPGNYCYFTAVPITASGGTPNGSFQVCLSYDPSTLCVSNSAATCDACPTPTGTTFCTELDQPPSYPEVCTFTFDAGGEFNGTFWLGDFCCYGCTGQCSPIPPYYLAIQDLTTKVISTRVTINVTGVY